MDRTNRKCVSKALKPDNLSFVAKHCWSCENYGCRENCCEDSEIENCKTTNSTDIFDMPLLLTYFVFAQQKRLQKFRDPEMGNLIIETHHATDTWEFLKKQISHFFHISCINWKEDCKSHVEVRKYISHSLLLNSHESEMLGDQTERSD